MAFKHDAKYTYESKNSIRDVELASDDSRKTYEITPYSFKKEQNLNITKVAIGIISCFLGLAALAVGVQKKIQDDKTDGKKFWITSVTFITIGTLILYNAFENKYRGSEFYT
jgi:putative Mn2+ efflux pump MntP